MNVTSKEASLPSPDTMIHIESTCATDLDVSRFLELLLRVWCRIHESDRLLISTCWKQTHSGGPSFSLVDKPLDKAWATTKTDTNSDSRILSSTLLFDWPVVSLSPDNAMITLISHEMAHVYQYATGKDKTRLTNNDVKGQFGISQKDLLPHLSVVGRSELHADELMVKWGFDRLAFLCWTVRWDPRITDHGVTLRERPLTEKYARRQAYIKRHYLYIGLT